MNDRFQAIRDALAMGPTPGPWDGNEYSVSKLWSNGEVGIREYIALPDNAEDANPNPADMHWIAACDPDTIRELLKQRDELLALVHDYRASRAAPVTEEMVEALKRIRDTAMEHTLAARIPECGVFGCIAQDADWLMREIAAAMEARHD